MFLPPPVLSRIAMDIISVQPSLVASESAFSTSGRVLSIRRTRLTPASLEMYNQKGPYTPQNPNAYQGGSVSTKHGNEANKKPNQASTRGAKKCRRVAHSGGFGGKGDKVVWNIVINKDGDLGYREIENDVDEVYNETASFMAAKIRLVALLRVEVVMGGNTELDGSLYFVSLLIQMYSNEDDLHLAAQLDGVTRRLDANGCKMVGSKMA
ncbi:zinc finger BED domain-containing protein RICESLEEPER 2-like protein [Tanacetum coccineum]